MSYATENDLRNRLGSDLTALLADEDGDGTGDSSILAAALEDASDEIDAALAGRYATPVSPAPAVLARIAIDLAVYFLFIRRRRTADPEHLERWKQARAFLDEVASGKRDLEGATQRLAQLKSESTTREQPKKFDRTNLEPY